MLNVISHMLKVLLVTFILVPSAMAQESGFTVTGIVGDPPSNPGEGWTNLGDWQQADALGFTINQANQFYSCQETNPSNNYNPECNAQLSQNCATLQASQCVPIVTTADECESAGFTNYQAYKTGAMTKGYQCTLVDYTDYTEATGFSPAPAFSHWCQGNSCGNEMATNYRALRTKWNGATANDALCQAKHSQACQSTTLTLAQYDAILAEVAECADYPSYNICLAAAALGYDKNATDAALFAQATANTYSAWCGAACNTLTKTAYNTVLASPAFPLNYQSAAADHTLWQQAVSGVYNTQCRIEFPTNDCNLLTKANYQIVVNNVASCNGYTSYSVCKDALAQSYGFGDHALYAEAQATTYDDYCQSIGSNTCANVTMANYVASKALALNCVDYTNYAQCTDAQALGYALNSTDAGLFQTALADTANNSKCITTGSLATGTANACSKITKTQYNGIALITAANNALTGAIGNASNADALTVADITNSEAYTNFTSHGTACSAAPSAADLQTNLNRFKYFLKKATFTANIGNVAKQLCFATTGHTNLTWHNDAPTSYIIASDDNGVAPAADFKTCGFWGKRTAISKTSTNAMKSASNTIVYDVKAQDSTLQFTAPSISGDKGHAVLNYTLSGQGVVSAANMTLAVLGKSSDGFIKASTTDRVVSVSAENKIQTSDAVYNVFQKTASSRTSTLQSGINNPSGACPAGYSMVSTTSSSQLTTLRNVALKHGTGAGTMPSGHRMEQCANSFLECNAGYNVCSNPTGANWRMRLMIYGEKNGQTCGVTRKKAPGNTFHTDTSKWPSGFSMYNNNGQCSDVGSYSGTPRLWNNGCVGWCWVRVLCKKNGSSHAVWQ